jgi:signal recognition particle subunit SEC65
MKKDVRLSKREKKFPRGKWQKKHGIVVTMTGENKRETMRIESDRNESLQMK